VCLVIMDGWGIAPPGPGNAIALADTPAFDGLLARYPHAELDASGAAVGLPDGQMGNSEVGHLTIGAGAIVKQELTRINEAVQNGELAGNDVLRDAMRGSERVHLLGLTSTGGVHSSLAHLHALIELAAVLNVPDLVMHCITDGRDTSPTSGAGFLADVERHCIAAGTGRIASVVGRFWAMDRDNRWDRTQLAYDLFVGGRGRRHLSDAASAAGAAYGLGETDEFIMPTAVGDSGEIRPGDSVICFNFRPDRMREIVRALADPELTELDRHGAATIDRVTTMTIYQQGWPYPAAFGPVHPADTLAAVVARSGAAQLHVAETEKYAHVTYFLGGGHEQPEPGERRELVPSARDVPTYDHKPEMSAREITQAFEAAFAEQQPALTVINFANADMVGHTGVLPAAIAAVEVVDECLGRVVADIRAAGGACVITADHGNAEQMLTDGGGGVGGPNTAHSCNRVPLIVTVDGLGLAPEGGLSDVAPTVLDLLGIEQPAAMTGHSLAQDYGGARVPKPDAAARSST
jgi:2,3-bisphosphoglycerate-independent phosphoglycerate mutase